MDISLSNATIHTAPNGVKIYVLDSPEFEVLRLSFVFEAGSIYSPTAFIASATANLLSEGSTTMSSSEIAQKLDFYGSYYDVNVDRDNSYISFCSLTKFIKPTLEAAEEIILNPIFPQSELETYVAKRKQRLTIERQRIETKAREEFAKSLFGASHPYGNSSPTEAYDNIRREHIVEFYNRAYTAANCFVVCSGSVDNSTLVLIEQLVGKLPAAAAMQPPALPEVVQRHYHFVEEPKAVQSSIRVGRRLFTRSHPDFVGMQVVATLLGGYFGSRLMQSLREERGYTYGVVSAMVNFAHDGYLAIATQVGTHVKEDALQIIYAELERIKTEPVPAQELEMVQHIMAGEMMRILDGPFGIADVTIENILCGTDNSAIEQIIEQINSITPTQIQGLAQKYLDREDMITVVAGGERVEEC